MALSEETKSMIKDWMDKASTPQRGITVCAAGIMALYASVHYKKITNEQARDISQALARMAVMSGTLGILEDFLEDPDACNALNFTINRTLLIEQMRKQNDILGNLMELIKPDELKEQHDHADHGRPASVG